MKKWSLYLSGFIIGLFMIGLFTLGFNLQGIFGDVLFAFSMMMWPIYGIIVATLNITRFKNDERMKNLLTKSLFMPLTGAIVMVALLYVLL